MSKQKKKLTPEEKIAKVSIDNSYYQFFTNYT